MCSAPKAAFKLIQMVESDRPVPQASQKLAAAQTILDRVGVSKTERLQVDHNVQGGIFVLPSKDEVIIESNDYEDISNRDD